jgi:UDP-N-acetylmuramoylalanine--D-glutamate ligase
MLESILRSAGLRAVAAGNVGLPLVTAVRTRPPYDVLAVELSSFQLHWSSSLRMRAAAVLNVAEDHLDWHGSMRDYAADKAKIWAGSGCAVVNLDDAWSVRLADGLEPRVGFTLGEPDDDGFGVRDGWLVAPGGHVLLPVADLPVPGPHNVANALAAAALARAYGVADAAIAEGLRRFAPGHHRNEVVAVVDGVSYVDDSKATNPHAAAASLAAYPSVVWVAGGLLKGADVEPLVADHAGRLRAAVLIGRDRERIVEALARHAPDVPVVEVAATDTDGMADAVRLAAQLARPGDTVLLAPAAASMDMFRDYAERGERFAAAARALAGSR